ncbi:MAG: M23 family metallopeptidase [Flavobacteriaceae bacterium]|nr:M23 family metallopeptidase [Flavobacteriaceae bacterium]
MKNLLLFLSLISFTSLQAQKIASKKVFANDSVYISLINPFLAPVEFEVKLHDQVAKNFKFKEKLFIEAQDTAKNAFIIPISIVKDTSQIDVNKLVSISGDFGNSKKDTHSKNYLYTFPFQKGMSSKIIQSFGGKFSHDEKHSKYAIDFDLKIGDTVTAARPGIVILTKEDSKEHCRTRKCIGMANKIIVMHDDGTFAQYVHLHYDGALVEVGEHVEVGQAIGISGLTGFTTKPHLHFVVFGPKSTSVPIYFKGIGRKKLKPGKRYKRKL